ncbi:DUF262 domain-containing protein [Glaciimonas sp. PCH181]|uniref:DUF262 domain-containing protein n=1 Tax=Glaciimonas sp. PCH181 TaxID=2133943 RepID=UPI000D3AE2E4|nr:DUF262 domain-containing protein [Glaciimonas sp. PCH181]PUA19157.1 hypothetical protein C7W93_04480 [Glaciimonas sp. PCH181]
MSEQQISLTKVNDLRVDGDDQPIRYRIPAYQRGYRWEPQQVTQLLEDIRDFTQRESPQPEEFYCLQPLVLRLNEDDAFEVVDGQQRLTTLLLILRHFNDRLAVRYQQKLYTLEYETRPGLLEFLNIPSDERAQSNIDFFHVDQAVKTIEAWFESHDSEVEAIKSALLNQAKVIWFQLAADEDPVDAFTRLNVGKIPLSNGELIRALFLRRSKHGKGAESSLLQIALEWDQLEKALQDNEFWCFLSNDTQLRGNRIGFLFDLIAREDGMRASVDTYATFYHFSQKLNEKGADIEKEWLVVKRAFMQLEEWFRDRRLYHLVGFLIWSGMDVNELRKLAEKRAKRSFKEALREKIFERAIRSNLNNIADGEVLRELIANKLDMLEYGRHSVQIRTILLLFNLATLLRNPASNLRFQFEGFKTERWDIEHVRSIATARPGRLTGQREWLAHCQGYLKAAAEAPELLAEIGQFMGLPPVEAMAQFEVIYESVLKHFQELDEEEPDNSIANLVLLDATTNRSYKNAVFAVKRQRVLALDRDGVYVPLCTRNVFLKCYSSQVEHAMFWTQADNEGYRVAMNETLKNFFEGEWVHE